MLLNFSKVYWRLEDDIWNTIKGHPPFYSNELGLLVSKEVKEATKS